MSINFIPSGVGSLIAGFLFSSAISPASAAARLDEVVISASRIELPREQVGLSLIHISEPTRPY
mgnify:CR=1 FL=1